MSDPTLYPDLLDHLSRTRALTRREAQRVVADVLGYFGESVECFVRRRHRELQSQGLANPAAFEQIRTEVDELRFRAPALSERQIRRLIYG